MLVHSANAVYLFRDLGGVTQFKIVQDVDCALRVALVSSVPLTGASSERLRVGLRELLDMPIDVEIAYTETIEPEPSGKYPRVVSKALARAS
jgi:phenylacetate-CoA ligase